MTSFDIYQLDAFADRPFAGNPAAVCPLDDWLPDDVMQAIALENNLSETAFFVPRSQGAPSEYDLRWFTPAHEVDLCGHATLASARVVFSIDDATAGSVRFHTRSGWLTVRKDGDRLAMDLPSSPPQLDDGLGDVAAALGAPPVETLSSMYGMAVFADAATVASLTPDFAKISELTCDGIIATAPGAPDTDIDFVSRFFAPKAGIPEDPVTGSAHCVLTPYWSVRLGKTDLRARQISARGGEIWCTDRRDRVTVAGQVAFYSEGRINL